MVSVPANPKAIVTKRYPVPAALRAFEAYRRSIHRSLDLQVAAVNCVARAVELLAKGTVVTCDRPAPDLTKCGPGPSLIYGPIPPRPTRARTEFGRLADALNQMEA